MKGRAPQSGFTLLELLVALAIFALMSAMAYGGLQTLLESRKHTDRAAEQFSRLQNTLLFLQQDLSQVVERSVRDELGDREPVFSGADTEYLLQLTRGGAVGRPDTAALQRVAYRMEEGRLQRVNWPVLDRVQGMEPLVMELVDGVTDIQIRFLHTEWQPDWPGQGGRPLPRAVEIHLVTDRWGEIRRVFPIYPKEET